MIRLSDPKSKKEKLASKNKHDDEGGLLNEEESELVDIGS